MRFISSIFLVVAISFVFSACNTLDVYENTIALPKQQWPSNLHLNFKFNIADSVAYYNLYLVLRHSESYHFNNIWINFTAAFPQQKPKTQKLDIMLADNNAWMGTAMDDIIEQRLLINKQPIKLKSGDYAFSLQQIMREDPLQNVFNAGIRVEKLTQ